MAVWYFRDRRSHTIARALHSGVRKSSDAEHVTTDEAVDEPPTKLYFRQANRRHRSVASVNYCSCYTCYFPCLIVGH